MVCRYPQFFGLPLSFYSPFEAVANFGLLDLVQYWNRTLKSEVLGEWEALSRTAKVRWAEREGHNWLSLQHDGGRRRHRATTRSPG